jgi:tRNA(Ile)-lysidine synthase
MPAIIVAAQSDNSTNFPGNGPVKRRLSLVTKVGQSLRRFGVGGGMVVAVSGGPDSVALLRALVASGTHSSAGPLVVAHLNHGLRGAESDGDEDFVRSLCAELGIVAHCESLDVRSAAIGANLEATARRLRYDWLAGIARQVGAEWVATGHTANDQAETVLHRLLRGAGLAGLRGIAPRRELTTGVTLIRPLMSVNRQEVIDYLEEIGQPTRLDSTNLDPALTRNRLRHELLPLLAEQYNPQVIACLCRLAAQAEEMFVTEEECARVLLAEAELPRAGEILIFDRQRLAAAPRHRIREAFRLLWQREDWPMGEMGFDAWERLAAVTLGSATALDLPGGITVRGRERVLRLERREEIA